MGKRVRAPTVGLRVEPLSKSVRQNLDRCVSCGACVQHCPTEALIEKAVDALGGIKRILDELRTSAFENIRSLLKTLHSWRGRNLTLGQILNARSEGIAAFLKLLDQLMELEKGG